MRYFAYGSNLLSARLQKRTPSATVIGMASLAGHSLRWHKRGKDGSGKCDALCTGIRDDKVVGAVFEIDTAEKAELDRVEGLGLGYMAHEVSVVLGTLRTRAFTYLAHPGAIDANLAPYAWYKALVVAGAREHALPDDYLAAIHAQPSVPDVDAVRSGEAWDLLAF